MLLPVFLFRLHVSFHHPVFSLGAPVVMPSHILQIVASKADKSNLGDAADPLHSREKKEKSHSSFLRDCTPVSRGASVVATVVRSGDSRPEQLWLPVEQLLRPHDTSASDGAANGALFGVATDVIDGAREA